MTNRKKKQFPFGLEPHLIKFYIVRIQGYIGSSNFIMLLWSVVILPRLMGWDWYIWLSIIGVLLPTLLFYDLKYVYPREVKYNFEKNKKLKKEFTKLKKGQKEIKKELVEIRQLIQEKL